MMDLYGNGLLLGEKTLDSLWMRQNLTMNNIANVDTPGFKSQYMTWFLTVKKYKRPKTLAFMRCSGP